MMRIVLLLLLLLAAPAPAQEDYEKANTAYSKGRFSEAAELYRKLEAEGYRDAELYYNLGNAYFELKDLGRARAGYERARQLAPRDADLAHNLALLRTELRDNEPDPGALVRLAALFTENELVFVSSLFYFLAAGLALAYSRRRNEGFLWGVAAALVCLLFVGGLLLCQKLGQPGRPAVVIPQTVHLKNGPGREFTDSIPLHAGTLVQALRQQGDWREVAALERVKGWIRSEELDVLD
ncbi:MAG: tetratricopeptide repeat protein [Armatimonadetes bacterium]|nr:tetratricopeptide repeat protein [Armatimonadota bacterium]